MGLLFVFLAVILCIILIARFASKTRPDSEKVITEKKKGVYTVKKIDGPDPCEEQKIFLEGLMTVLEEKGLVTEEEVLSAIKKGSFKET